MNHLDVGSNLNQQVKTKEVQVYANVEEQAEMKLCHQKSINLIAEWLKCFILNKQ